jgi:protein-S-isoprenylcysteine O-methyltransferase Ste14
MKLNYFIDSNKGITFLVILGLMAYFDQWDNPTAWVYLALHGTYGLLWVMKTGLFPDANWTRKTSLWFGLVSWAALMLYWIPAFLLMWRGVQAPLWLLALAISLNILGVFFVFTADMQKFTALKLRPNELITDGMFGLSRNINYFGEFLIYAAFALLPMTWLAFIPLALFIVTFWIPNMVRKEKVLAGLPGYEEYRRKVKAFFPFLF